jgi:hypothetical protein
MENGEIILRSDRIDMDLIHFLERKYTIVIWKKDSEIYIKLSVLE